MTTYTYEFTAFTEDALLNAGSGNGSNLGYGDSFTMPASADVTFVVTDNDPYLSGDSQNNENANDSSYQTATITIDGEEAGNGGQVYGEQYFWVYGSSGNWYLMIEIEQEGTGDDYFTFYNAYGVPEEGESLTVSCGGNISCWEPHMGCLEAPVASIPPVAVLDAITITEGDSIGDNSDDAQLNILANDFDTDGTISLTGVNGALPGEVVTITTDRGTVVDVTVDANGNLFFDTGSDFDALRVGETDSFQLTYTITDNDGNDATSTVTVTIEGETTVDAVDDVVTVFESEGAGDLETLDSGLASVLANDMIDGEAYEGLVVTVNGQTGNVGQWIELDKGRVKLNADGTIDFDADGDFDALNDGESEAVTLNYTISAVEAGEDEYQCLFFNNLATGEIVTDQFASAGVTISSANAANPVMIFDTANPTGGDTDLATSNLGNVLILSEDGDSADPDDNAGGGTFIFDFERAADIDSITMLDTEEPAPQIRLYGEDGMLLATIAGPVTADGGQGVAQINTAGVFRMEIELQGSGALDNLIYTIDGPTTVVDQDTATVTVNVLGEDSANGNLPPDAVDDFFSTVETTPIDGNVLGNDSDPENDPISVIAVEGGEVGGEIAVTTSKGNTGIVTVGEDGAFTFTPDDSFISLAEGEVDTFDLTYTITDDPSTAAKTNLLFVLDVSNSTVGQNGQNVFDGVGVGDVNNDGRVDTVLDAEIQAVISSVNKLLAQGVDPSMVDIGLVTFSGLVDLSRFAAPFNTPTADADTVGGAGTSYQLDSAALIPALQSIMSGGWTNYEAGLQEAEGWLASNADSGEANKVIFLSDGRPIIDYANGEYVSQDNSDYGDEVTRIVNNYDADITAIGVGANSSLEALDDLDNTGGAEQVLDVETLTVAVEDAVLLPLTDTATITVTINGVNDLSDGDETAQVDEGSGVTILTVNALDNADDPDGGTPVVTSILDEAGSNGGTFAITEDGEITFDTNDDFDTLAEGETTTTTVTYTVTDGQGGEVESSVTVTVVGVNDLDDGDETAQVDEGSGATVLAVNALDNAVDPDGGAPVVTPLVNVTGSNGGTFSITADGIVTFDTNDNFADLAEGETTTTSVTYTVTDGQGGEVQSTYTVTVNGINQLPVIEAVNDFIIVGEAETTGDTEAILDSFADTTAESSILANDLIDGASYEGLICEVNGVMGNVGEWIDIAKGRVMIMADGSVDFDAAGQFDALNTGESDFVDVDYTIGAVDSEALDGSLNYEFFDATPAGNSIFNIPATGADFSGTASDFDVNALAQSLTGDTDTYAVRYTGFIVVDAAGDYNFEVGADDGVGIWVNGQLVADRDGLNGFGTANGDITLTAGVHEVELRFFENLGGQGLDAKVSGPNTAGQVSLFDLASSSAPMAAVADEGNVAIRIDGVDAPNQLEDGDETASVFEDTGLTVLDNALLNTVDLDSDPANIMIASLAGVMLVAGTATAAGDNGGSFTFLEDGTVSFDTGGAFDALTPGEMTTTSITYQVTDGDGGLVTSTYTVEVTGVNDAPVAVANNYAINEGEALTGANIITDPDQSSDIGEADSDPNGDALVINSAVGNDEFGNATVDIVSNTFVTVYTDGGVAVEVKLDDAGNLEVSENSEVEAAGDQITLSYTVEDVPANGDVKVSNEATVTVSIADVPDPAGPEINVVFLLDASSGAVTAGGSPTAVGDLNDDGKANSIFDFSIDVMQDAVANISTALGAGAHDIDIGVYSFESQITTVANEFTPAVALADGTETVFDLDTDFAQVIADFKTGTGVPFGDNGSDIFDNGAAFMAAAMEAANGFISDNIDPAGSGDAVNLVYVIGSSLGADIGNDYVGAGGLGVPDGNPDGFASIEYLENLPDPLGPLFEAGNLDPNSDVALTNALLASEDLGLTIDTLYFGGDSIAFNSGLFALENFQPDASLNTLLADGTINTDTTSFLNGVTTQIDDLLA